MVKGRRGYTLVETIVVLTIFGGFLLIIFIVTSEMQRMEKKFPVNFVTHPYVSAVLSRLRKDVLDATYPYYPTAVEPAPIPPPSIPYEQTPETLLLYTLQETGYAQTIVWDFRVTGEVRRKAYSAGALVSDWVARGVPKFKIDTVTIPTSPDAVRISAVDSRGRTAVDQVLTPRPHQ
jgi:prepilin-type N-terminal cleavage/methylation domain-containing protein